MSDPTVKTRMTVVKAVMSALLLLAVLPSASFAGPPLATDDSETPGRKGWEVNLSHNIERTRDEFLMETPLLDFNYGFRDNDQFKVEFALLALDPQEESTHWGISDLLIGYKYRFLEEDEAGFMASVYPQVLAPVGNADLGLGSGSAVLLLPVQAGKHFAQDRLFVYGELGYDIVFENASANSWKYGVAAEWKATDKWELMAEVAGFVFPGDAEPDDVFFNIGTKLDFSENVAFIGSAGRSLRSRDRGVPDLFTFVGLQITWGGNGDKDKKNGSEPAGNGDRGSIGQTARGNLWSRR